MNAVYRLSLMLRQIHGNIVPIQGDVTKKEDLQRIVNLITAETGYINVFIANSGIQGPGLEGLKPNSALSGLYETLWSTDFDAFTNTYAVNTSAVFFSVIAFLPLLEAGNVKGNVIQKSQVIATSSVASFNRTALVSND